MAFTARDLTNFIPEFSGDQATLHDFIAACDHAIDFMPDGNESHIPFLIKSKLIGEARQFISSRALNDWQDIKQLLLSHFGDTRDAESLLRELTNSFQKSTETPRSYVQRVQLLLTKIRNCTALDESLNNDMKHAMNQRNEKIGLKTILSGLNDPIGQILRSQRPQNIEEATSILAEEENLQFLKSFRSVSLRENAQKPSQIIPKNFKTQPNSAVRYCGYCKRTGHSFDDCYRRQNRNIHAPAMAQGHTGNMNKTPQQRNPTYNGQQPFVSNTRDVIQQSRNSVIHRANNLNELGEEVSIELPQGQQDQQTPEELTTFQ